MAYDDDLFEEEFDFVDEEDEELAEDSAVEDAAEEKAEEVAEEPEPKPEPARGKSKKPSGRQPKQQPAAEDSESAAADEPEEMAEEKPEPEGPPADHVVHVYEFGNFKRTIQRDFTSDDAKAFAEEFNRTSATHAREAVVAAKDEEPALSI